MKNRLGFGALVLSLAACGNNASPDGAPAASASAAVPAATIVPVASAAPAPAASVDTHGIPIGIPFPAAKVLEVVNPKGAAPYKGPTGTLKGTIRLEGDEAPAVTGLKIPSKCGEASATYSKIFRVGLGKTLADAVVTVTGFDGIVPAEGEAMKITIHGCALARRTIAATFGQRIEVANLDPDQQYMPYLVGAPSEAILVAVGNGSPVKLYPQQAGHYLVRDMLPNPFLQADVFVLPYATHDVTGLDGQYEIKSIPVGRVKVNAFLPVLVRKLAEEKLTEIKPGENKLDFTIKFDLKKDMEGVSTKGPPPASTVAPTPGPPASPPIP
ncbi:MAG: hypothetical protein ABJE95_07350 [Byssovorax sp.]